MQSGEAFEAISISGNESDAMNIGVEQRAEPIPFHFKHPIWMAKMARVHRITAEAGTAGEPLNSIAIQLSA